MKHISRCLAVSAVLAAALPAHADVASTFDSGAEGWTALTANLRSAGSPVVLASVALNYVPAGYITAADADFEDTLFVAPTAYLGNQGSAYGGSLSYSLTTDLAPDYVRLQRRAQGQRPDADLRAAHAARGAEQLGAGQRAADRQRAVAPQRRDRRCADAGPVPERAGQPDGAVDLGRDAQRPGRSQWHRQTCASRPCPSRGPPG